jgi:hypothetical protein
MIRRIQPGETVIQIGDGTRWRVLYHDQEFKVATCERTENGVNIVRAIRDIELRLLADQNKE